jgi:catechol 2,3-dioxygenase-like lactoylglutathione lyase family enzyme
MKIIPLLRVLDIKEAIFFYTAILDFVLKDPDDIENDWGVHLVHGHAEIQLTKGEEDQKLGIALYVLVNDMDARYEKYISRGLDTTHKKDSPVHQSPLLQTWGTKEFYVNDPSGNTLRFVEVEK